MNDTQRHALEAYSRGDMSAIELRRRLGGASYGDVLRLLSEAELPLPRARGRTRRTDQPRPRLEVPEACPMSRGRILGYDSGVRAPTPRKSVPEIAGNPLPPP